MRADVVVEDVDFAQRAQRGILRSTVDGSIAAASIVAKVHRDSLMRRFDEEHPGYGFGRHVGYGTAEHMEALRRHGPSRFHRQSFRPVAQCQRV